MSSVLWLKRAAKGLARRAGADVRRHDPWATSGARRRRLLGDGGFGLVLDVGANAGQFGRELRENGYRSAIVSFEPLSVAYERLEEAASGDPEWHCRRLALGETGGRRPLNVATNEGASSSFLPLNEAFGSSAPSVAYAGAETVEVATLDELAGELFTGAERIWLKLDVQGYELRVLEGATSALPRIDAVEIELSFVELYTGQSLFDEVIRVLQDAGFRTVDVSPEFVHPTTGRMLQVNVVALRAPAEPASAG
jgi:FkbM family methyltransferase